MSLFMCRFESLTDVLRDLESFIQRDWPSSDPFGQRFALYQFEDQKPRALRFLKVVDRRDVGVIERRENFRFSLKSADAFAIPRELVGKNLDRDLAFQLRVPRPVHFPIPPLPSKAVISCEPSCAPI